MALNDKHGDLVLCGTWLYGGDRPKRIEIAAYDHDWSYLFLEEMDGLRDGDEPKAAGPDGRLYFVKATSSPGHQTLDGAKAWADSQPWGPVAWDD